MGAVGDLYSYGLRGLRGTTAEHFYQKWLGARYEGTAPRKDLGLPYREALRIPNIEDPVLAAIFPNIINLARGVIDAIEK